MRKLSVPLLKQGNLNCGPTVLRMVLCYFGKNVSQHEIIKKVGGTKKYGIKTVKLAEFARNLGFETDCYSYNKKLAQSKIKIRKPKKSDIINFLKKGLPVIIAVRTFLLYKEKPSKTGHFIVLIKYEKGKFWYNDPNDGKEHKVNEETLMCALLNNALDSSAYLLVIKPKD